MIRVSWLAGGELGYIENFYQIIHDIYATCNGQIGTKKILAEMSKLYDFV